MRYTTRIDDALDCYYVDNLVHPEGPQLAVVVPLKHHLPALDMARLLIHAAQWFQEVADGRVPPDTSRFPVPSR